MKQEDKVSQEPRNAGSFLTHQVATYYISMMSLLRLIYKFQNFLGS